jgi:ACT domain-containing protein
MNYPLSSLLAKFDQDNHSEQLRIVLIGSANQIVQTTHQLHSLGFADVNDWSPLLPLPNSSDLFSLLTRRKG